MGWAEIKKAINSNLNKALDILIVEKTEEIKAKVDNVIVERFPIIDPTTIKQKKITSWEKQTIASDNFYEIPINSSELLSLRFKFINQTNAQRNFKISLIESDADEIVLFDDAIGSNSSTIYYLLFQGSYTVATHSESSLSTQEKEMMMPIYRNVSSIRITNTSSQNLSLSMRYSIKYR